MLFQSTVTTVMTCVAIAAARPIDLDGQIYHQPRESSCMTYADAQQVANNWASIFSNYTDAVANSSVASHFREYSSSTNYLISSSCSNGPTGVGQCLLMTATEAMLIDASRSSVTLRFPHELR